MKQLPDEYCWRIGGMVYMYEGQQCSECGWDSHKPKKKYWYKFSHIFCPVCCSEDVYRERVYDTPKPENYYDRHETRESYDWCQE